MLVITQVRDTGGTGEDFLDSVDRHPRARARAARGRPQVEVTGAAGFGADAIEVFGDINGQLLLAAGGLVLILLILIYRSPIFWTIPFFTVLFAEACARGFGYLLAEAGVTINGQSGGILPVLVFGAGTDYALLLVSRYREELRRHDSKHEAMQLALSTAGPAIVFSGLTVMAALLVLLLAEVNGTAGLGPIGAMGILLAMVFMLTMLPAALVVVGRRAFWPFVPDGPGGPLKPHTNKWRRAIFSVLVGGIVAAIASSGGGAAAGIGFVAGALLNFFVLSPLFHRLDVGTFYPRIERPLAARHRLTDETHGFWRRVGDRVAAAPARVAAVTTLILLVLSAGLLTLDTGLTSGNSFRGEVESVRGSELLAQHYPAGANVPTTVVIPDRADVEPVTAALEQDPAVAAVGEPVSGPPGVKVDVQLRADPYSTEAFDQVPGLRETVKQAGGEDVLVGGPTAAEYDLRQSATRDNCGDHPRDARRRVRHPCRAAARAVRAGDAGGHRGPVLHRGARHRHVRLEGDLRLPGHRPVAAAAVLRLLGGAGDRLQHLPDGARARGDDPLRHARGDAARARGHRRGDHVGRHRAGGHVQRARRAAADLPDRDRLHRRVRRAARHVHSALDPGAGAHVPARPPHLVAVAAA